MTTNIAVVAHDSRDSVQLRQWVRPDKVSTDNGTRGCNGNHLQAWRWHAAHPAGWSVVLEDDAIPMGQHGFRPALDNALTAAPYGVVSLYLGRCRPRQWQTEIAAATLEATERKADWIVAQRLYHAVGVAVHHTLVASLVSYLDAYLTRELPIDEAISDWLSDKDIRVAYTWPSMVEHSDTPTLVNHPDGMIRGPGRVAWCAELKTQWSNSKVVIP